MLQYKGYQGTIEQDDQGFNGRVLNIPDIVSYEGETLSELQQDFQNAIEHYLSDEEEK